MCSSDLSVNAIAMQRGRTTASNAETEPPWLVWGSPKSPIASIASTASTAILVSEMLAAKHAAFHVSDAPRRLESLRLMETACRVLGLVCISGRPCFS